MEGTGIGATHAIRVAMADALRRAADDLESKPMDSHGKRRYNISFEGPSIYTLKPEEGPAALRAVALEIAAAPEARRRTIGRLITIAQDRPDVPLQTVIQRAFARAERLRDPALAQEVRELVGLLIGERA